MKRDFPDVDVIDTRTREELDAAIPEAEILFSWAFGDEVIARAKRLRWLHVPAAGVGSYLTPSFRASGAVLTNSRGAHAIPIAEHVMAGLLGIARRMKAAIVEQTTTGMVRENWWAEDQVPDELHGKTIGLFGYGAIGREVARRAAPFGMRVIALRRRHVNRSEGDVSGTLGERGVELRQRVRRHADDERRPHAPHLTDREIVLTDVHAGSPRQEREVGPVVREQRTTGRLTDWRERS